MTPVDETDLSGNVLVVYRLEEYPLRAAVSDHLYSLRRHSRRRCFYLNLGLRGVPSYLPRVPFDAVVFHTSLLSSRWASGLFEDLMVKAEPLKGLGRVRVALPQDEFFRTDAVARFVEEFDVNLVLSVSPESEWPKQYPTLDRERVRFEQVLTGYLDESTVARADRVGGSTSERPIDVGYRAWNASQWLGGLGRLKTDLARVFGPAAEKRGLSVDISTRHEDTILGDDWLRFLASCKYTIGVEGGASVLDADGSLSERTEAFLAVDPDAGYERVEAECFPGRDGELALRVISPRHLEACATRTCQVLIEGTYSGVLRAGEHFIELREDFSNLPEVLDLLESDERRSAITEAAYRDVVASGDWTYVRFVSELEMAALGPDATHPVPARLTWGALCRLTNGLDALAVGRRRLRSRIVDPARVRIRRLVARR